MVDVKSQYLHIKNEVDRGIEEVINSSAFINGPAVKNFQLALEQYLDVKHVIPCANGTDALQIALMALDLNPGDEVIVPAFTYVATAEVIGLLGLTPIMVDVDYNDFNIDIESVKASISSKTKAIVPVHLYGQSAQMEELIGIAQENDIYIVEDNAQAIGADFIFKNGKKQKTGTIGHIGCTSFYPSKNLGCYGDGGAICTNDDRLAEKLNKIANHGQSVRYYHDIIGCNSRLDSIQAAVLNSKLPLLDEYNNRRREVADFYDKSFSDIEGLITPVRAPYSTHVFHQYTLKLKNSNRDQFKEFLDQNKIPNMIYYPVPLYKQKAFMSMAGRVDFLPITELLCQEVISLPIHTEMDHEQLQYITSKIIEYFT